MTSVTSGVLDGAMVAAVRPQIARSDESRKFVDDLLGDLSARRFRPGAWVLFFGRSMVRSVDQARARPVAAAELTAYHLLAWRFGGRRWTLVSWLLTITHLGLLGESRTMGWPNRLTVLRGLLPSFARPSPWTAVAALASDFTDGRLARRAGETAFGAFADPIADGVFWSWYALRRERNRWLRWAPLAIFAVSTAAIAGAYFVSGRAIDYPRPIALRYVSAATQIAIALRSATST
ncbi:MAG TPA: CDP-alcohol phosphatidyltransferase family protein [Candidatus Dormibacteraeota bacterium]|nr:CDP-alcohol phosphatidyltransferase family protein [Candidatus Dormibacteraeota bacterium]